VLNPALAEMMASDRIMELRGAATKRSLRARASVRAETAAPQALSRSVRHDHLANSQRAIGWFLVSVGLRLALPRTRAGSAR
jgi:hypothetical protein